MNVACEFARPTSLSSPAELKALSAMIARLVAFEPRELLQFFRSNRAHMNDGLFTTDNEFSSLFNSTFLVMTDEVCLALTGGTLTQSEMIKIDKTKLSEVLLEENGFVAEKNQNVNVDNYDDDNNNDDDDEEIDELALDDDCEDLLAAIDRGDIDAILAREEKRDKNNGLCSILLL
jgi:hypothetical protein